jgi:hypothetical protein
MALLGSRYQVDVVAHDHPCEQQQALLLLAETQAVHDDVLVFAAREDIHPSHRGERNEIQPFWLVEFVGAGHGHEHS